LTTTVAIIVASMADQTRSGFFLMNRSIIKHAGNVSPRKVILAQIKGFDCDAAELIYRKRFLLIPVRSTIVIQRINVTNKARLILYGDRINIKRQIKI